MALRSQGNHCHGEDVEAAGCVLGEPKTDAMPVGEPASERRRPDQAQRSDGHRSEEHTSELQSRLHLVCRLLLEKKKKKNTASRCLTAKYSPNHRESDAISI